MARARLFRAYIVLLIIIDGPIHDKVKHKAIRGNTIVAVMK